MMTPPVAVCWVSALTAFALVFLLSGMPRLHHAIMEVDGFERVSIDRFWRTVRRRTSSVPWMSDK